MYGYAITAPIDSGNTCNGVFTFAPTAGIGAEYIGFRPVLWTEKVVE